MLHIRMLSGEELDSISVEELSDVAALKRRLNHVHGLPTRFRQRLLLQGNILSDDVQLSTPMDLEIVLLPYLTVSQTEADGLAAAAGNGSVSEVERMLRRPQDPNLVGADGTRALSWGARRGHADIVQLLLEARADKDLADGDGRTALIWASGEGHVEVTSLLLEGADMDVATNTGATALIEACSRGHAKVASLLLRAGADLDLADDSGSTALMFACYFGYDTVVRLLLEANANTELADNDGETALVTSCWEGHFQVAQMLLDAGADKWSFLRRLAETDGSPSSSAASKRQRLQIMTWLLTAKAKKDLARNDASAKSLVVKKKNDRSVAVMCAGQNRARPQKVRDNDGTESESTACEQHDLGHERQVSSSSGTDSSMTTVTLAPENETSNEGQQVDDSGTASDGSDSFPAESQQEGFDDDDGFVTSFLNTLQSVLQTCCGARVGKRDGRSR